MEKEVKIANLKAKVIPRIDDVLVSEEGTLYIYNYVEYDSTQGIQVCLRDFFTHEKLCVGAKKVEELISEFNMQIVKKMNITVEV